MREPSVRTPFFGAPSWVSCVVFTTLGGGSGRLAHMTAVPAATIPTAKGIAILRNFLPVSEGVAGIPLPADCAATIAPEWDGAPAETDGRVCAASPEARLAVETRPVS